MATNDRLPAELDCSELAREWPIWKRSFLMYLMATGKNEETEKKKIATFLWLVGPRGMEIYNNLFPNDGTSTGMVGHVVVNATDGNVAEMQAHVLDDVIAAFDRFCIPLKNPAMESFKFNKIMQQEKQRFAEFETEIRKQVQHCSYKCECGKSYENRMLIDRIIVGVNDEKLQLKLLDTTHQSLSDIIEKCKAWEAASINKSMLDCSVNKLQMSVCSMSSNTEKKATTSTYANAQRSCYNCGSIFGVGHANECRAKGVTCHSCGKLGHFVKYCKQNRRPVEYNNRSGFNQRSNREGSNNHSVRKEIKSLDWYTEGKVQLCRYKTEKHINNSFYRVNYNDSGNKYKWTKEFVIEGENVTFKLDTGSDINCIPRRYVLKNDFIKPKEGKNFLVFDYNNNKVNVHGTIVLECLDLQTKIKKAVKFFVVDNINEPILGLGSSVELGLIKRLDVGLISCLPKKKNCFVDSFSDIFEGLGKFPEKQKIVLDENVVPVLHYRKRIPHSLLEPLKRQLDQMVLDKIISPVSYPTNWVNNLQIVEKANGSLRICLDPKPLNKAIKREHFLIPTMDDFTSKMMEKKVFSVLDLSCGFWQMELDEDSSKLTTFMTPFGRFKFNRVPFGISCAPEMFQRVMVKVFGDLPGVIVYFDDICIMGKDEEEHDKSLQLVIKRARENGIKFNKEKIQYRSSEVYFMGHIVSPGQVRPQRKYIDAIVNIKKPMCKQDVMRILGFFKYIAKFMPNLSAKSVALRKLTRNDTVFEWGKEQEQELSELIRMAASDPVLAIYDKNKPVVVQTDASKDGMGCVLLQEGKPVAYASRTLSNNEQKWAQIEKELLAVVFSCELFHYFLYGREFTVESDHKPLETLIKRDIDDVTARLQGMVMSLLKYPKLKLVYKPGKEMLMADCLSRAQLADIEEKPELSQAIHSVTRTVCLSENNYKLYIEIFKNDELLGNVCSYLKNGWPSYHQLDEKAKWFHRLKGGLHFENGLLFYNHRLVIPKKLQNVIGQWLHAPHLGIEKTLARARNYYYWPNMNKEIKELVSSCKTCEKFKRNIQKEELKQEEKPLYPYYIVGVDIFEYAGINFLAIMDAYSGYLVVKRLKGKSASHIIKKLKNVFNKLGYPTKIRSDNNPFNSIEFDNFVNENNIVMQYSSPRYPQSNGLAEKGSSDSKEYIKAML